MFEILYYFRLKIAIFEIDLAQSQESGQGRVILPTVVNVHVTLGSEPQGIQGFVVLEFGVLVFESPPEMFHLCVVETTTLTVHADPDPFPYQDLREFCGRELPDLIRIENLR